MTPLVKRALALSYWLLPLIPIVVWGARGLPISVLLIPVFVLGWTRHQRDPAGRRC